MKTFDRRRRYLKMAIILTISIVLSVTVAFANTNAGGIISSNTTWPIGNSPYTLTADVQIAYGSTLIIEPGVIVNGNGYGIKVWGNLSAVGTSLSKIVFNNAGINGASNSSAQTANINIQFSEINGGNILYPSSMGASYGIGSFTLSDSIVQDTTYTYLWYPLADCYIVRNIFANAGGISVGTGSGPAQNVKVYIRNNVFYKQQVWSGLVW